MRPSVSSLGLCLVPSSNFLTFNFSRILFSHRPFSSRFYLIHSSLTSAESFVHPGKGLAILTLCLQGFIGVIALTCVQCSPRHLSRCRRLTPSQWTRGTSNVSFYFVVQSEVFLWICPFYCVDCFTQSLDALLQIWLTPTTKASLVSQNL